MTTIIHLTPIKGATLLAWHNQEDVQAVRLADGEEALFVDGKRIPIRDMDFWPVQQVVFYCRENRRSKGAKLIRAAWKARQEGA